MASTCKYNNSSLYNTISHYPNYSKLNSSGLFGELRHIFLNLIARSLGCPLSFPDPSRLTDIYSMQSSNTELWEAYAQSIKVMKFHDRCLTCHVMSSSRQCKKKRKMETSAAAGALSQFQIRIHTINRPWKQHVAGWDCPEALFCKRSMLKYAVSPTVYLAIGV